MVGAVDAPTLQEETPYPLLPRCCGGTQPDPLVFRVSPGPGWPVALMETSEFGWTAAYPIGSGGQMLKA